MVRFCLMQPPYLKGCRILKHVLKPYDIESWPKRRKSVVSVSQGACMQQNRIV